MISPDQGGFIRAAAGRLRALHIDDNEGRTDQHLAPFASGTVPWAETMAALREIGYDGLFNLELPGENKCPLAIRLAKLDYLARLVALMIEGDIWKSDNAELENTNP